MDKGLIVERLKDRLREELAVTRAAASAAREGATHEEAKPENEYDTRGLEQSYLAGAQTARAEALAASLSWLESFEVPALLDASPIRIGSCVVLSDGERERLYFLSEVGGGTRVDVDGSPCWVLTPESPLGTKLVGCRAGDVLEHEMRGAILELEVTRVF
ncbi:MAG: transcription elongation factor GreAB [Myxococcota bacterium]